MNGNRSHPPPPAELWTKNQQQRDHSGSFCSLLGRWWPPGQRGLAGTGNSWLAWLCWWFFVLRHLQGHPRGTHFSKKKNDNQRGQGLGTPLPTASSTLKCASWHHCGCLCWGLCNIKTVVPLQRPHSCSPVHSVKTGSFPTQRISPFSTDLNDAKSTSQWGGEK